MLIEFTKIGEVYKEGKWPKIDIMYIRDGKPQKRTLVAINEGKQVVQAISSEFSVGDMAEVEMVKSEDGQFWNWVGITKAKKEEAAAGKTSFQGKGNYETPEERARRQVYIVRQSSLSNALEYLNHQGDAKFPVETVLKLADQFTDFVFNGLEQVVETKAKEVKKATKDDFEDDVPF